jgi:hypothetical protein
MIQINTIRLVVEYIFIINLFGDINANNIFYKLSQIWANLTGTDHIIVFFCEQREYVLAKGLLTITFIGKFVAAANIC